MLQKFSFLIVLLIFVKYGNCDGHYSIVGSKHIRPNSPYHVAVTLHDSTEPCEMKVGVKGDDKFEMSKNVVMQPYTSQMIEFQTGEMLPGSYKLFADGLTGIIFKNESDLNLHTKSFSVFIQTDKAIYKPGDTVKFRVLVLDANMRPAVIKGQMKVFVNDGRQNRLKQWVDAKTEKGVFSDELPLSTAPVLGDWNIVVEVMGDTIRKSFEVAEYVLPKFEVSIDSAPHVTYKEGVVRAIIRSKYTYGKPVKGEATVSISPKFYGGYQPLINDLITRKVVKVDGKGSVEFNIKDEMKVDREDFEKEFTIDAVVEEELTGRKQNASINIKLHKYKYKIKQVSAPNNYKPGLPFEVVVQVVHHDGSPVIDKTNKLYVSYGHGWNEENFTHTEYNLDSNGMAVLTFNISDSDYSFSVSAKYLELKEQIGYFSKADTKTGVYIQTKMKTENPTINNEVEVTVQCTEKMKSLTYQVLGRGDVLVTKTIEVPDTDFVTIKFFATFSMVPKAQLIVYYFKENKIASDRIEIEFGEDLHNFIKLELSTLQASPGQDIDITVSTRPNSYVGLLGVDQSVLLLKKGNDLSKDEVFSELNQYNQDYYPRFYRRKRFYPGYYNDIFQDFSSAGAILLTNAELPERIVPLWYYSVNRMPVNAFGGGVPEIALASAAVGGVAGVSSLQPLPPQPVIRKTFPESWIWETILSIDDLSVLSSYKPRNPSLNSTSTRSTTLSPYDRDISENLIITTIKKTDIGPAHIFKSNTRPPYAGPYAFSRIPKSRRHDRRVFLMHEIYDTWLFYHLSSGSEGRQTIHKKVPDTITSWIITGFSVDPVTGLGLTKAPRKLEVFQPFFVSLDLPYSMKRGEIVSVPIVIFNYMENNVEAEVILHNADNEFEFTEISNEVLDDTPKVELFRKKRLSVASNSGASTSFMIKPKIVGSLTIKVTATTKTAGDGIQRILPVEPEGVPQYINKAIFVDLREKNEYETDLTVEIPKNAVPDSTRIDVSVVGDLLGSTIKNLDSLIRMPYGCGEQNMLNFVPNIVILDYLTSTQQLTPAIETKAKKFTESGYQRELTYKHEDGSFSAFGKSDDSGSTWLTAFVVKSFRQAARYIDIDEGIIDKGLEWLSRVQAPNGSFPEVGRVCHSDMQGGSGGGIALTAYTLIAFLENKDYIPKYRNTIDRALEYIVRNTAGLDDIYALALASYALQLSEHSSKDSVLKTFDERAATEGDTKWWNKPIPEADKKNIWYSQPNSVNVEMTAYGLLTFMAAGKFTESLPIMKWLVGQRNDQGGFQGTQDTVVGLAALALFAGKITAKDANVQVVVKYADGIEKRMNVNKDNSLVLQSQELPSSVRTIHVSATGHGFVLFQVSYKYNLNVTGASPRFTIDPIVNKNSNIDYLHLSVCTSFVPAGGVNSSNMAVMEVGFPSGFSADLDTLPSLEASENVKKVETKDSDTVVVIYFDNLGVKELCPTLDAFRTHKVAKQKPAPVTVYDYYDNSRRARMFYETQEATLCDICEGSDCGDSCKIHAEEQVAREFPDVGAASVNLASLMILTITSVFLLMF